MKSEEIRRREAVKIIAFGPASLLPLAETGTAAHLYSVNALAAAEKNRPWKPRFFSEAQNELVATIAELIIPETDTPGARAARVHEHIDLVLSEETPQVKQNFLNGLAWIDYRSQQLHGSGFLKATPEQQVALLSRLSDGNNLAAEDRPGRDFFLDIRHRTVFGYYTSKIGIHEELNYKGNQTLDHWVGCPHPDHHGDS